MAGRDEISEQTHSPINHEHDDFNPESEDEYQTQESPGMQKAEGYKANPFEIDDDEAPAKFMKRPVSSGSTVIRDYAYGVAPRTALRINKRHTTALYGAPRGGLHANTHASQPSGPDIGAGEGRKKQRLERPNFSCKRAG
jgi:hypothetical protein